LLLLLSSLRGTSDVDEIVEHGIRLVWILGGLCVVCIEATETAEIRPYDTI